MIVRVNNVPIFNVISDPSDTESDIFASDNGHSSSESEKPFNQSFNAPSSCEKIQAEVPSVAGK